MEETTLAQMEQVQRESEEARSKLRGTGEALKALEDGSAANIEGLKVALTAEGKVRIYDPDLEKDLDWTPRQLLGLAGWTHTHIGGG